MMPPILPLAVTQPSSFSFADGFAEELLVIVSCCMILSASIAATLSVKPYCVTALCQYSGGVLLAIAGLLGFCGLIWFLLDRRPNRNFAVNFAQATLVWAILVTVVVIVVV